MGHVISAECVCGYSAPDLIVGAGREDFLHVCMQPAYCQAGAHVVSVNVKLASPFCDSHKESLISIYFKDEALQLSPGSEIISSWQGRDINSGTYLCPKCRSFSLRFSYPHMHFDGTAHEVERELKSGAPDSGVEHQANSEKDSGSDISVKSQVLDYFNSIEQLRAVGHVIDVADSLDSSEDAIAWAMARSIGRSLQLDRDDFELVLLVTAERERFDGRLSIAAHYQFCYLSHRDARIQSSIYRIISENRQAIETAIEASSLEFNEVVHRVFSPHARHPIEVDDFSHETIVETMQNIRTTQELSRNGAKEVKDLSGLVHMERTLSEFVWWLTAWRTVRTFFRA